MHLHSSHPILGCYSVALALHLNISVLLVDVDIVFLKQPFSYLQFPDMDFVVQRSEDRVPGWNSGIFCGTEPEALCLSNTCSLSVASCGASFDKRRMYTQAVFTVILSTSKF